MEKQILAAALASRSAFNTIVKLNSADDLSPQGSVLFKNIEAYYLADQEAGSVDRTLLMSRIERTVKNAKHVKLFESLVSSLPETSSPNLLGELSALKKQAVGHKLIAAISQGTDEDLVSTLIEQYQMMSPEVLESTDVSDVIRPDTPLEQLLAPMRPENLIKLLPKSLNDRVDGGVLRGHHVGIFARPETGKTLHAINLTAGFLRQGLRVVFVENEDPKESVICRLIGRLTGASKQEIVASPSKFHSKAMELGYGKFLLAPLAPGTFFEVAQIAKDWGADVVVIDQLPNMYIKGAGNNTERLAELARAARTLAKRQNVLVISMMQAGDSASDKLILNMGDCDGSNTGIPAQLDLMIGIGHNEDFRNNGAQMLTLCKNKVSANHDNFTVFVEPATCRVKGT